MDNKTAFLFSFCETWANAFHDGHLIVLKFTGGYKAAFSFETIDREFIASLKTHATLYEALISAILEDMRA